MQEVRRRSADALPRISGVDVDQHRRRDGVGTADTDVLNS
jgi:hypothetical protein